jgi:hypothetical protein
MNFENQLTKLIMQGTSKNKTFAILVILFVVSMVGGMTAAIVAISLSISD